MVDCVLIVFIFVVQMRKIIIAIDGYSACGKSTTAKKVAEAIEYNYIDTGAMYRAVTLYFLRNHIRITNPKDLEKALNSIQIEFRYNKLLGYSETFLNGLNVENEIRSVEVTKKVSQVSAIAAVRQFLVAQQQEMGKKKGVVMDGRDIGTHVFPEAELKIFMTADMNVRAHRRQKEFLERGQTLDLDEVIETIQKRDEIDTTREESPLRKADDAIELDTSDKSIDEEVKFVISLYHKIIESNDVNI